MKQIHDAISQLLVKKMEKYLYEPLNDTTCNMLYRDMFDCLVSVFQETDAKISNEAMNLLAQMYYDSVKIKSSGFDHHELNPNIFEKRASVKSIPTSELAMLGTMFSGTPFAEIFIYEVKRRS